MNIMSIVSFFERKIPQRVTWEKVREEIRREERKAKVKFEVSPFYYMVKSGRKTWYWVKDTGEFDGTSWDMDDRKLLEVTA